MAKTALFAAFSAVLFAVATAAVKDSGISSTYTCTCAGNAAAAAGNGSCVCPSTSAPGGLKPSETPQFILFTHDDAITPTAAAALRGILDGRRSVNGCQAVATLFTLARGTDCNLLRGLYNNGHEVASHSLTHQKMNGWSREQVAAEVLGGRSALASQCGIPSADIVGWRQPYLQAAPVVRQVLAESGFLYDSTILETPDGGSVSQGMAARLWPYTLQDGVAQDCKSWSPYQTCAKGEAYPGLFEVPVWDLSPSGLFSADPDDRGGRSILKVLNSTFRAAYDGNRAPVPIFVHSSFFTPEGLTAMQRFADYVLSLPHVYFVSARQLLAWLRRPSPAAQLTPAILGCGNAGGAGPAGSASSLPPAAPRAALGAPPAAAAAAAGVGLKAEQPPAAAPSSPAPRPGGQPPVQAARKVPQQPQAAPPTLLGAAQGQAEAAATATTASGTGSGSNLGAIVGGAVGGALAALSVLSLVVLVVHRRRKRTIHAAAAADRSMQQAERMHVHASRMQPGASALLSVGGTCPAGVRASTLKDVEVVCVVEQTGTPGSSARRRGPTPFH